MTITYYFIKHHIQFSMYLSGLFVLYFRLLCEYSQRAVRVVVFAYRNGPLLQDRIAFISNQINIEEKNTPKSTMMKMMACC